MSELFKSEDVYEAIHKQVRERTKTFREVVFDSMRKKIRKERKASMKRVVVESPYAGNIKLNEIYGEFAMHDCLVNYNEAPYASHLLYTRNHVLRDHIPEDRKLGISAGFFWRNVAQKTIFYTDLGMTTGMIQGLEDCEIKHNPYETRSLPEDLWEAFVKECEKEGLEKPKRSEQWKRSTL